MVANIHAAWVTLVHSHETEIVRTVGIYASSAHLIAQVLAELDCRHATALHDLRRDGTLERANAGKVQQ
jgi:hypothetical protein